MTVGRVPVCHRGQPCDGTLLPESTLITAIFPDVPDGKESLGIDRNYPKLVRVIIDRKERFISHDYVCKSPVLSVSHQRF